MTGSAGADGAPPVTVRDATGDDAAEVAALADLSWDDVAEIEGIPRTRKLHPLTEKKILAHGFGEQPCFELLVAERDGRLLGFLLYTFGYWTQEAEPFLSLDWLFVHKEARRQGVGTALVREARAVLAERRGTRIFMQIWDTNIPATLFYCRLGGEFVEGERTLTLKVGWPAPQRQASAS